jgi:hypothetical protein
LQFLHRQKSLSAFRTLSKTSTLVRLEETIRIVALTEISTDRCVSPNT